MKLVFNYFASILGKSKSRSNSLLVRTIFIACMISCQRIFVPNLIILGVVLGRDLVGNNCSESFDKNGERINEGFTS